MASIGGNLLQRTRCGHFRDVAMPCNKRVPGSGCPAISGANRMHAVLGTSDSCVATHASDVAVALVALDAEIRLAGSEGVRTVRLSGFYRLPGDTPDVENDLRLGELITEVVVPRLDWAQRSTYVKVRDRQSYEFALTSAAVALDIQDSQIVDAVRGADPCHATARRAAPGTAAHRAGSAGRGEPGDVVAVPGALCIAPRTGGRLSRSSSCSRCSHFRWPPRSSSCPPEVRTVPAVAIAGWHRRWQSIARLVHHRLWTLRRRPPQDRCRR